jgi:hypothetical protein
LIRDASQFYWHGQGDSKKNLFKEKYLYKTECYIIIASGNMTVWHSLQCRMTGFKIWAINDVYAFGSYR